MSVDLDQMTLEQLLEFEALHVVNLGRSVVANMSNCGTAPEKAASGNRRSGRAKTSKRARSRRKNMPLRKGERS